MFYRARTQIIKKVKSKSPNPTIKKKKIMNLSENFFEKIFETEIKLKTNFSIEILKELINYYIIAIEYYESKNDIRSKNYSTSLNLLLSQPEVLKNISMLSKNGKNKVLKEERKKIVLDEIEKIDKSVINEIEKIIISENQNKKK
jgi:hypothetical protein